MHNLSKKLISLALAGTTIISFSGALLPVASAQSVSDLQAQISALLQQIQQLQSKLNSAQGGSASSYSFTRDLTVGSKGADVKALQQFLNANGAQIAASGAGSPGNESTYFGSKTKAALAKYQAAHNISPAAGYFGPKSRSYVASLGVSAPSSGGAPSPVAPASGLVVSFDANNPSAGALISSSASAAARVPVLRVDLTAGSSGPVTVSEIKFRKTGVLSDSSIAGAYLTHSGRVLYQYNSISNGVVDFAGLGLVIPAGQSYEVGFAIDPSTGLTAGNTVGFSLASAADINSVDANGNAIVESGAFPFNGNTFTVTQVSNPSIASLTVASTSIATTDTAGTQNNIVGSWNFSVSNSKVWLKSIKFTVIGSANNADLRNVKLMVNGAQVGATLAAVGSDGSAYIDASAAPGTLNTGSNNVQVFADVMGSPNKNFQFEILNAYDVYVVDSQYNVPIAGAANTGTQVSIQQGQITVSTSANTPTGNIAPGQSGVTLAQFTIYAAGEAVKVKFLDFKIAFTGNSTTTLSNFIKNVALTDDAGGQIGTTINTPPTSNSCAANGTAAYTSSTNIYLDCFGTSASPINYIVPANTTRVLSLKGDLQTGANFSTLVASLISEIGQSNLQGLTSSATNSSGGATGASLTLQTSQLTVAQNGALGNQSLASPATGVRVGSYAFTASSADGVTVSTISVQSQSGSFQNLRLMVNGSQFGTTQGLVSASGTYSFSGSPFTIPKGGTTYVDVFADILSGASSVNPATNVAGCSATGQTTYNALSCSNVAGQGVTIAGQATVSVSADSSQAPAGQIVMGSTQNPLATFRFTETSNVENVKVTQLTVADAVASTSVSGGGVKSSFSNLTLYNGSTAVGSAGSASASGTTAWTWTFNFATPFIVPQANSLSLVLKGDAASYSSSGATDNATHVFKILNAAAVTAYGNTSQSTSSISLSSPNGNTQTVLRSRISFSATALGVTSSRAKNSTDNLATLSFSANAAGAVALNTLVVNFTGNGVSSTNFLNGIKILDENNNSIGTIVASTTQPCSATGSTCSITFNFGSTSSGQQISAGASRSWTLVVDDTKTLASTGTNVSSLSATINAQSTDLMYTDALDSAASTNVTLPSSQLFPIQLNSVSFVQGT